jgi:hypothetical protein
VSNGIPVSFDLGQRNIISPISGMGCNIASGDFNGNLGVRNSKFRSFHSKQVYQQHLILVQVTQTSSSGWGRSTWGSSIWNGYGTSFTNRSFCKF